MHVLVAPVLDVEVGELGFLEYSRHCGYFGYPATACVLGAHRLVYCSSAWNWLFLVKVMIFSMVPNLEI